MPKVTDQHKAQVRERLVRAAVTLLATKGYHATSTRDIIAGAGVSAGTFYHYFDSKDDLIAAAGASIAERELGGGIQTRVEGQSAAETMAGLALRFFAARPGYSMLPVARAQASFVPAIRESLKSYDERVVESVAQGTEEAKSHGDVDGSIDAAALAELSLVVFEGLQARARAETFVTSYERVGQTFLRLLAMGAAGDGSSYREAILRGVEKGGTG